MYVSCPAWKEAKEDLRNTIKQLTQSGPIDINKILLTNICPNLQERFKDIIFELIHKYREAIWNNHLGRYHQEQESKAIENLYLWACNRHNIFKNYL